MNYSEHIHNKFSLAVDCIVFGFTGKELNLLLIHRGFDPGKDRWSLMGGFVEKGEHLKDAPKRVLKSLTGLDNVYLEQVHAFGDVDRDPGDRVVSVAYYALIRKEDYDNDLIVKHNAEWFPINKLPELLFDHEHMVQAAKRQLILQSRLYPIGFNLLPPKFTLMDLQLLYESICDQPLDNRNFRKRVLSLGILKKLDEKQKGFSKKGAFLYEFDRRAYEKLKKDLADVKTIFPLF